MNRRSLAMLTLCLGTLMIVLDTTIVNVALPSIKADLHFDDANLAWVVNAYLLTFGGFLLFGGRLGDWYGQRKLFLIGMVAFTLASLACGLATSQGTLIVARAVQGVGGAVVEAVALSMVMAMYVEPAERAKAMGVYGFVAAGGGALGVVAGGILTQAFSWHWTFLVNVPVGLVVFLMALKYLPKHEVAADKAKLDVAGALTVTASLVLAVYAIVNGNQLGWLSVHTLSLLACSALLFVAFVRIEQRVATPLVPFRLLRGTHLPIAGVMGVLWAAAMFSWFFLGALYLQQVLDYSPLAIGLAFLPANLIMALFSISLSAKLVMRFGTRSTLASGMLIVSVSLLLFARAPVDGQFLLDVLPSMVLLGVGCGMAMTPMMMAAMEGIDEAESGLASGILNTAFMRGGALGLATLASAAAARSTSVLSAGDDIKAALTSGYHLAFYMGAAFALLAAGLALRYLKQHNTLESTVQSD